MLKKVPSTQKVSVFDLLMMTEVAEITGNEVFLQNTLQSRELLYKHFAPKMYGICLRFAGNKMEADDILHEAFVKIYTKIKNFRNEGSLEGWIRRTIINTAINFYRRNSRYSQMLEVDDLEIRSEKHNAIYGDISREELLNLIQELPIGYRTVFNLNIIEGYTHKEIGEMLNISDNTSKSQLTRARMVLQKKVEALMIEKITVPFENLKIVKREKTKKIEPATKYLQAV
ncbi:MAG: sigma-70 family RNA polymerase sigma factor [Bacteroidales bacterium]|nr:sigma-70 family RNA polymerase sigma factor [Bacteroidales bacterium]